MADIRLLATDLDGTILGDGCEISSLENFRNQIAALRRGGASWVISTGRSLKSFRRVFAPLTMLDIMPDFVIVKHAYIFGMKRWGYVPHRLWNLRIRYLVWKDGLNIHKAMGQWHRLLIQGRRGIKTLDFKKGRLCLRFSSEEAAEAAAEYLTKNAAIYRQLRVFKYVKEVDVRTVPFTKGLAVQELARHLGVPAQQVLAIGDGHNDISMLDPEVAAMIGCPLNAAPEIVQTVNRLGGHIAQAHTLNGVLDVIQAYQTDSVRSEIPVSWRKPGSSANPFPTGKTHRHHRRRRRLRLYLFVGAILLTALLSFANFDALPFSSVIAEPLRRAGALAWRLVEAILYWR